MGSRGINDKKERATPHVLMEGDLSYFSGEISSVFSQKSVRIYRPARGWATSLHTSVQNIL